jgi:hypothetical protein
VGWQTYEARFCRFDGPANWQPIPGFGLVNGDEAEFRTTAMVMENWNDPPLTIAEYVGKQREILQESCPETELVDETIPEASTFEEAHLAFYRTPQPDRRVLLQKQLTGISGPLACTLTISGMEDDLGEWELDCHKMLATFTPTWEHWASKIERIPSPELFSNGEYSEDLKRVDLRSLSLSVTLPQGWVSDEDSGLLRLGEHDSIEVRRTALPGGSAEECFAEALHRFLADAQFEITAWDSGVASANRSYWALEATATQDRTWGEPIRTVAREVFVDDEGVIAFLLRSGGEPDKAVADFGIVVTSYEWLPVEERLLRVGEPWLDVQLEGNWMVAGPGTYAKLDPPSCVVSTSSLPRAQNLGKFAAAQVAQLKKAPEIGSVQKTEEQEGSYQGCPAYRWHMDFDAADGNTVALRFVWFDIDDETRNGLMVRTEDTELADRIFVQLIEGFRPDSGRGGGP